MTTVLHHNPRRIAGLGYKRDMLDPRDHLYTAKGATLPEKVDLVDEHMPPVWDQSDLGSCVWHGTPAALMYARSKAGAAIPMPSRLAGYYETRHVEGDVRQDAGCEIRDAIKVLSVMGDCPETEWPYDIEKFKHKPTAAALADMKGDIITQYQRVATLDDALDCIVNGYPVVFGITCYPGIDSDGAATTGYVPMPTKHQASVGGHCILMVGFDNTTKRVKFRNSWSDQWGDHGYGYLDYAYVTVYASDMWTIRT